ncbi:MAG: hypothetical protein LIQ31_12975 [Planctomycetes bacterium]|nr:hypothetical protein [Planctomycetota bacterium]
MSSKSVQNGFSLSPFRGVIQRGPNTGSISYIDRFPGGYSTNFGKTRFLRFSRVERSRQLVIWVDLGGFHLEPEKFPPILSLVGK